MQVSWFVQLIGWILLVGGIILVVIAFMSALLNSDEEEEQGATSRGLILIGPIPIVWGYGKRGWLIAGALAAALLLVWMLLFF
jgi:uncharacterized protein (TIGR00304 family)